MNQLDSSSAESDLSEPETSNRSSDLGSARSSCGFSEDSVSKSRQQNQNLKNLISGLENEDPVSKELEVVKDGSDVIMRMVEDFGLMSESDTDDEPENLPQHHQVLSDLLSLRQCLIIFSRCLRRRRWKKAKYLSLVGSS